MTKLRVGDSWFDITPSLGPSSGSVPTQPVTSFGSAAANMDIDLAGGSCMMVILGHTPEAKVIDELVTDLWLLGDFPMRYRVWAVWQDFDEHGDDRVSFQGVTYERLMNRRHLGAGGLLYTDVDMGTIIWNAIQHTQAKTGGDLGITQGTTTVGHLHSVDWLPGENIGSLLEELSLAHNVYWFIDEDKKLQVRLRDDSAAIVEPIMWGVNARHLQRASAGIGFANSVYTSGSPETTPVFSTHADIATDPRGLWETVIARPNQTIQDEVSDSADGELARRYQGLSRWNVTYVTEHWVGTARIRPGDKATLIVPPTLAGPLVPPASVDVECISMSMSFNGDGGLEVRAVLEELSPFHALNLPGVSGDNVTTPDSAALSVTNDIGFVAHVALDDWTPAVAASLIAKWTLAGNNRSFMFRVNTDGTLMFQVSVDGTAVITRSSTVAVTAGGELAWVTDGGKLWVGATVDVNNGSGYAVKFWVSTDGATWAQLGATITTEADPITIFDSTAQVEIGSHDGTSGIVAGYIYSARIYSGVGAHTAPNQGTLVADFSPDDFRLSGATATDSTGNVWAVNGDASIVTAK